ncbi:peptidase S8/S53 domain-containing protein [Aspergillus spectabilis]
MSFSYKLTSRMPPLFFTWFRWLLEKLDEQNVVIVMAAANHALTEGVAVRRYPAKFADPNHKYGGFPNMIVVAASNSKTERADISNYSPWVTTFAPGKGIHCPAAPGSKNTMRPCQGTSFSAPQVAALASYFRAVPSRWQSQLDKPSNVKKLIQLFARRFAVNKPVDPGDRRPIIWNGQAGEHSCLRDYGSKEDWAKVCPTIQENLEDESPNPGEPVEPCTAGQSSSNNPVRRQSGGGGSGSCPLIPGDKGPGKNINWDEGPSGPECTSDDHCGGEVCKGYYCDPHPKISHPPDYYDPKDPKNPHGQPSTAPKPSSTTTSTPPMETPDPPVDTVVVCVGRTIEASWVSEYTSFGHAIYFQDAPCSGKGIGIGSINNFPEICDVADDEETADICDLEMTFVNRGPEFWGKCGFQISIDGKQYTPRELDPENENKFCSGRCDLQKHEGLLYYELPASACFDE